MAARRISWLRPLLQPRPSTVSLISKQHFKFTSPPRFSGSRARPFSLALIPILGGTTLYLDNSESAVKPIEEPAAEEFLIPNGHSIAELEASPSLSWRIIYLFRDYVIEPISTTGRFIHLAILFLPVILLSPLLLLELIDGSTDRRRGRAKRVTERSTTKWWYGFLVGQMARAGPTFIKVSPFSVTKI